jgi:hypothetical protein
MKKKLLSIFIIGLINSYSFGQNNKIISVGIDIGLSQNWTNLSKDETGVFINNQDLSYNINENYKRVYFNYTNKFSLKIDYTYAIYTDYICTLNNFIDPYTGKECLGSEWKGNQINLSFGKEFKLLKWLYVKPSLGVGYVFFKYFEVGYFGESRSWGSLFKFSYETMSTSFRNDNYNLQSGVEFLFRLNPILKIKFCYLYQYSLFKLYETNIVAWNPENSDIFEKPNDPAKLKFATLNANGSNTQFGVGLEFDIKTFSKKN